MVDPSSFGKLVPGFDFLEGLVKNAGAAMPGIGQWVAPTLNPEEIDKRIQELRTVQYWLEQNAHMLGATIQALEVQRMTLSTLQTMNVQMNDLRDALLIPVPKPAASPSPAPAPAKAPSPPPAPEPAPAAEAAMAEPQARAGTPAVDPMQWWGALTKQFTELAANAMKEGAAGAAKTLASAMPAVPDAAKPAAPAAPKATKAAPRKAVKSGRAAPRRPAAKS